MKIVKLVQLHVATITTCLEKDLGYSYLKIRCWSKHLSTDLLAGLFQVRILGEQLRHKVLVAVNEPSKGVANWVACFTDTNGLHHS